MKESTDFPWKVASALKVLKLVVRLKTRAHSFAVANRVLRIKDVVSVPALFILVFARWVAEI